jgi:hypothetical protein
MVNLPMFQMMSTANNHTLGLALIVDLELYDLSGGDSNVRRVDRPEKFRQVSKGYMQH